MEDFADHTPLGAEFLYAIAATVEDDTGMPGISGRVAIGVRDEEGQLWWAVSLGGQAQGSFLSERPKDAGVALLLGPGEALRMMRDGSLPERPQLLQIWGDRSLLQRFSQRYLKRQSSLSLRSEGGPQR